MTDEQLRILDDRIQMLAMSITAAILMHDPEFPLTFHEAIAKARTIVYDAKTSASAGNYS